VLGSTWSGRVTFFICCMWVIDALGGKLLHVLIDLRRKSAKFIHAHALLTLSGTLD
jgi:hypothetical protein